MKQIVLTLTGIFLTAASVYCQATILNYTSVGIPENLRKNADAVYRSDEGILDVTSSSKYTFTTHQVISLLNKDAAHHLYQALHYDKFEKIESIVLKVYDSTGGLTRVYQKKNFETRDYDDHMSLYTDDKLLLLQVAFPGYPCTIEINCQKKVTGYIELPDWIIATPNESVEYSCFTVKLAPLLTIRYRALNTDLKPLTDTSTGSKIYTWTAKNITASRPEQYSYTSRNVPEIDIVAQAFEYDGHKGELKDWQSFGAWNYPLYEDAKPFKNEDLQMIQALVAGCKTSREKIKRLYNYLEQTMRYVSIQLGIGGFKPFAVQYVSDNKYGDCKALTNYMRYLLKAVGINSYPALINAGYNKSPADINFPSDPFNHVILCVPFEKDSVWLECTSNNNECGFLGSFTENKNALLLTEKGGTLVATPKSNYANNILSTKTIITLDEDGSSQVTADIFCTGDFWNIFYELMQQDGNDKKDIFINFLHYKTPGQFSIETKPDSANGKQFRLILSYDQQYDFKTGDKMFFRPRLSTLNNEDIKPVLKRKFDYVFDFPYSKSDTTVFLLPTGNTPAKLPAKKEMNNQYASFQNEYFENEGGTSVTVVSNLTLKKNILPPGDYSSVANFFQEVKRIENEKFIVEKK